jgi:hypothetical protein
LNCTVLTFTHQGDPDWPATVEQEVWAAYDTGESDLEPSSAQWPDVASLRTLTWVTGPGGSLLTLWWAGEPDEPLLAWWAERAAGFVRGSVSDQGPWQGTLYVPTPRNFEEGDGTRGHPCRLMRR